VILKNLSKVSFLRDTKSIVLVIPSNFYLKVKVICIKIEYLELVFKMLLEIINIRYKLTNNKKVIDINSNNNIISNKYQRICIK